MIMVSCGMPSTIYNIKQNYAVKLSLINRNSSNRKSQ